MKGDTVLSLKDKREILALLEKMLAYHTPGVEDGYGADETERKAASFDHTPFEIDHETTEDRDPLMPWCPQCFSIMANRRIKAILSE